MARPGNVAEDSQLRKGVLELAVLAIVAAGESEGGTYGGSLVERLAAHPALTVTQGTVYPLLSRLRQRGIVATTWQESPTGPPRRYYRLTDAGHARLATQAAAWRGLTADMSSLLHTVPGPARPSAAVTTHPSTTSTTRSAR